MHHCTLVINHQSDMIRAHSCFFISAFPHNYKMDSNFDQHIFGQLVQPVRLPCSQKQTPIFQETPMAQDEHFIHNNQQPPRATTNLSKSAQETGSNAPTGHRSCKQGQRNYEKQLSLGSTDIGGEPLQHFRPLRATIRSISQGDLFDCILCATQGNTDCALCRGSGQVNGGTCMPKFVQYLMEFKLGIRQSYRGRGGLNETAKQAGGREETARTVCRQSLPNQRFNKVNEFREGRGKVGKSHRGYGCDGCGMYPIVGSRYHCSHGACRDDYDLCQHCYFQLDHQHGMREVRQCEVQHRLQVFTSQLCSQNNNIPSAIFSSSIY